MEDKWSEYWQNESATGECFVNEKGEKNPELAEFWHGKFSYAKPDNVLDIASGAGSIFVNNNALDNANLYALDFSGVALMHLQQKVPRCKVVQASATHIPFRHESFDYLVSQFGIEYAGIDAIVGSWKYLSDGGRLTYLSHIRNGFIDTRNAIEEQGAELCRSLDFIAIAKRVTEAFFEQDSNKMQATLVMFQQVEPKLAEYVRQHPLGVHQHLYTGFKQLFVNRNKYLARDITSWLDGMDTEIDKTILRIKEMRKAALDPNQINVISEKLSSAGARNIAIEKFQLSGHDKPLAWHISAEK